MKKVGIITLFHNSQNYGGLLQAYALCRVIKKYGYPVEQIRYDAEAGYSIKHKMKRKVLSFIEVVSNINNIVYIKKNLKIRKKAIDEFVNKNIPFSSEVYKRQTIKNLNNRYDSFVVGSDQVWNGYSEVYMLEFADNIKRKIAYAASVGRRTFDKKTEIKFRRQLKYFDAISVRERENVELIGDLTDKKVMWALDPTLLLDDKEWDEICSERKIEEKYLFCYYLGKDERIRQLAREYAKQHSLKIVTLPHLHGKVEKNDIDFGDYQLYDVSPSDFVSLIKNAHIVFTDSFHACVFSGIYKKQFFVFDRIGENGMNTRIYSICDIFNCISHFCIEENQVCMTYINNQEAIDYNSLNVCFEKKREESMKFLCESLAL